MSEGFVHRYIPNSAPGVREAMLEEIGFEDVGQIYEEIPEELRFTGELDIPKEPVTEFEVAQRIKAMLAKNKATDELLSFLGAGCWPHYVPALCDEIIGRSEFLTAYSGADATDYGRYQTIFEYQSMMVPQPAAMQHTWLRGLQVERSSLFQARAARIGSRR